jgi:peptidoglycan/xylan/chitin deacetylase (PgdA/CDA1 family)
MYHSVTAEDAGDYAIGAEQFRLQMQELCAAGYETVTCAQMIDYVHEGTALPEKPLLLTFDDGYENNLTVVAPILEELGMCATISVIGVSDGKSTYKETGSAITPHFALADAAPWVEKGVIEIGSHSYDMHQVTAFDGDACRQGVGMLDGEEETDYIAFFNADIQKSFEQIAAVIGQRPVVFAYPQGIYSQLSEHLLEQSGIEVTLTIESRINTLTVGKQQSLRALGRIEITAEITDIVGYLDEMQGQ